MARAPAAGRRMLLRATLVASAMLAAMTLERCCREALAATEFGRRVARHIAFMQWRDSR